MWRWVALVRTPQVFLLDEPLSNLDAKLRVAMRAEITDLQREVGVTTFYVTHDQVEAMTMADRVAVINFGVLQQAASPQTLFDAPDNLFVAAFIGSPSMNLLEGTLSQDNGSMKLHFGSDTFDAPEEIFSGREALRGFIGKDLVVGLRPKDFYFEQMDRFPHGQRMRAHVENLESLGHERMVYFHVDASAVVPDQVLVKDGVIASPEEGTQLTARFAAISPMAVGDNIKVAVDVAKAHFFDPASGLAIRD